MSGRLQIRPVQPQDVTAVVAIGRELVAEGTTYVFAPDTSDRDLEAYWLSPHARNYVALVDSELCGCYLLEPNHPGRGSHVAHASYAVARSARNQGVGRAMALHSLAEARRLGYSAMQFNLIVATNERAVALWRKLGFDIIGTLPKVFEHSALGLVDAHVMHRLL